MHSNTEKQQTFTKNINEQGLGLPLGSELYTKEWEEAKKNNGGLRLYPESGYDLQDAGNLEVDWIVENLVATEAITTISGLPGSFKTWLYQYLAVKVVKGEPVFGHLKTQKTSVLVFNEESSKSLLHRNFKQLGWTPDLPIFTHNLVGYKMNQFYADAIIETAKDLNAKLVVFDSFVRFNPKDENSSSEMSEVMEFFRQIAKAGIGVLIIHHNRKGTMGYSNPALDLRGSTELLAAVDCHFALQRKSPTSENVRLCPTKNRMVGTIKTVELKFTDGASEFELVGTSKTEAEVQAEIHERVRVLVGENPGASQNQLIAKGKLVGIAENKVTSSLEALAESEKIKRSKGPLRNAYEYFLAHPA